MSLSQRIFIAYLILLAISIFVIMQNITSELVPGMRQSLEEVLVDTSNLLAEVVEDEVREGGIATGNFSRRIAAFNRRQLDDRNSVLKRLDNDLVIYITDAKGKVIYDSEGDKLGKDYSRWNDVYLTLRGEYGARTTRANAKDPNSSVMYVAAPIRHQGQIIGVLTVGKPSASVQPYFENAVSNIKAKVLILVAVSLAVLMLIVYWLTVSIRRLTAYAKAVQQGGRVTVPVLREKELARLAQAMEQMRKTLDGKDYVENYLHTLTHELKSPLAAIRGAAELLQEEMPEEARGRFVSNINNQSRRLSQVVEQLLSLANLEKRQTLQDAKVVDAGNLVRTLCADKAALCQPRDVRFEMQGFNGTRLLAEHFLLQQAIGNILDNAIGFSPEHGLIDISDHIADGYWHLRVRDQGPGIPEYAHSRLFERFYSLPRPGTDLKSTGLGLSLVQEVAHLHNGKVVIHNHLEGGAELVFSLPLDGPRD